MVAEAMNTGKVFSGAVAGCPDTICCKSPISNPSNDRKRAHNQYLKIQFCVTYGSEKFQNAHVYPDTLSNCGDKEQVKGLAVIASPD